VERKITPEPQRSSFSAPRQMDHSARSVVWPSCDASVEAVAGSVLSELAELYDVGKRIAKVLPRMLKAGLSDELRNAMSAHSRKTNNRLEVIARISGLFDQATSEHLPEDGGRALDFGTALYYSSALISVLEGVEFPKISSYDRQQDWEIATFGRLLEWAQQFDCAEGADFLEEILKEENGGRLAKGRISVAV